MKSSSTKFCLSQSQYNSRKNVFAFIFTCFEKAFVIPFLISKEGVVVNVLQKGVKFFNIFAVEFHAESNFKDTGKGIKRKPMHQEVY